MYLEVGGGWVSSERCSAGGGREGGGGQMTYPKKGIASGRGV